MSSAAAGFLDNQDLGLDSSACHSLEQELGLPPPWPVAALKAYFDSQYPGWDDAPQLALSSPVSRLRGLADTVAHGAEDEGAGEALRELGSEVKHAQIRVMCPRAGSSLVEECNFLLLTLEKLGCLLLQEREGRLNDRKAVALQLEEAEEARRHAGQEAAAAAREEVKQQLEELATEAEAQRHRADELQRCAVAMQDCEEHRAELAQQVEDLGREVLRLNRVHETSQEELHATKAQRAVLQVVRDENETALEDLRQRLEQASGLTANTTTGSAPSRRDCQAAQTQAHAIASAPGRRREEFFASGARVILALVASSWAAPMRQAMLAWRCAHLEAKYARLGDAAAATSLEADLSVMGCSRVGTLCCCRNGQESCCRKVWLKAAFEVIQQEQENAELANNKATAATATAAKAASSIAWHRFVTAVCLFMLVWVAAEPHLDVTW